MKRLMNFLRGMATLVVTGPFPERVINLCAQEGIDFWGVEWLDEHTLRLTTRRCTLTLLGQLCQRVNCQVQLEGSRGLPDFLLRFRTRYTFLLGLTLSLCAVVVLSRFVLTVEVTGNSRLPTAVILSQLRQVGVRPGVYGPAIDRQQVAQQVLLELEDLAWMGINLHGTRLEVIVRETIQSPKRIDETGYFDLVAQADGIITQVQAELGDAVVAAGDTVAAGETLISGLVTLEPPKYSDLPNRYYQTHARGNVWARTWRTLTAGIPLEAEVKEYTGQQHSAWSVIVLGRRIEIFGNSSISWPFYDKITAVNQVRLPGDVVLPISLHREISREYQTTSVAVDVTAAQRLLEGQLTNRLENLVGEDGTVQSTQFEARVENALLLVTLYAECHEEIAKQVPGQVAMPQPDHSGAEKVPS